MDPFPVLSPSSGPSRRRTQLGTGPRGPCPTRVSDRLVMDLPKHGPGLQCMCLWPCPLPKPGRSQCRGQTVPVLCELVHDAASYNQPRRTHMGGLLGYASLSRGGERGVGVSVSLRGKCAPATPGGRAASVRRRLSILGRADFDP